MLLNIKKKIKLKKIIKNIKKKIKLSYSDCYALKMPESIEKKIKLKNLMLSSVEKKEVPLLFAFKKLML